MNKLVIGCVGVILTAGLSVSAARAASVPLAENGKSDYRIVLAEGSSAPEKFAAQELQLHLEKATGAKLPIVDAKSVRVPVDAESVRIPVDAKSVRVPPKSILLIRAPASAGFAPEECRVRTEEKSIVIEGEGDRGVLYGVYAFLERKLGARWYTSMGVSKIDRKPTLVLTPFSFTEKPRFSYRGVLTLGNPTRSHPEGILPLIRNRMNIFDAPVVKREKRIPAGGFVECTKMPVPFCHNLFYLLPPTDRAPEYYKYEPKELMPKARYGKDHPEWYALKPNGKRDYEDYVNGQLCFSNEEMGREFEKNFLSFVEKTGGEGIYAISPQDGGTELCLCEKCQELVRKYKTPGAPLFVYDRHIAEVLLKRFPKAIFKIDAYGRGRTEEPPVGLEKFPPNVIVSYAPRHADYSKPFTSKEDQIDIRQFKAWSALAPTINRDYTFIYGVGLPPFHNFSHIAASIRLADEQNSFGCEFEHGEGTYEGRSFFDMQTWILLQLYRNPKANWHDLAKEYCDGVFGPAAAEMLAIVDLYQKANDEYPEYLHPMSRPEYALTPEKLVAYQALFAKAEQKAAGDGELIQRIREVRLGFDSETITRYRDVKKVCPDYPDTPHDLCERGTNTFIRARQRRGHGCGPIGHEGPYPYLRFMVSGYARATTEVKPLPKFFDQFKSGDVYQIFPGQPNTACVWVKMKDAAMGYASRNTQMDGGNAYVPKSDHRMPFRYGFTDVKMNKVIFHGQIEKKDVVPDEFHCYKLGRGTIPNDSALLHLGWDWVMNECPGKTVTGDRATVYDFYASIKFEGPTYCGDNAKVKKDGFYVDRYILVRVTE